MKSHVQKTREIRLNVLKALKLYKANLISQELFQGIAANALAWEITTSFERKTKRKEMKHLG